MVRACKLVERTEQQKKVPRQELQKMEKREKPRNTWIEKIINTTENGGVKQENSK